MASMAAIRSSCDNYAAADSELVRIGIIGHFLRFCGGAGRAALQRGGHRDADLFGESNFKLPHKHKVHCALVEEHTHDSNADELRALDIDSECAAI